MFWFVFQVGFKNQPVDDFPFILWLICGVLPWFYFSDAIQGSSGCILEYNYLVKKVVFRVSVLPIVKILSALFVHLFFVVFIFIMFKIYGYSVSVYNFQFLYYLFALVIYLLGLSWITSAILPFFRDLKEIISIFLQFGFWLTPIFWSYKNLPLKFSKVIKLNPMFYIVEGYRDSFINHVWFWERYNQTLYFWVVVAIYLILGAYIFRKLKDHFSDVL